MCIFPSLFSIHFLILYIFLKKKTTVKLVSNFTKSRKTFRKYISDSKSSEFQINPAYSRSSKVCYISTKTQNKRKENSQNSCKMMRTKLKNLLLIINNNHKH